MHTRILLVFGLMLTQACAVAQIANAPSPVTLAEARAQRDKAKKMKAEARKTYEADVKACQGKAIAIGCMSSAKERRSASLKQAEALELEGRTVEREIVRGEAEAKAARREAEASKRQAREHADIERYRESEAKRAAERERKQAEEPAKLESRRNRIAAEKAARERKLAEREKKDAREAASAAERTRKKAEKQEQQADRVKKIEERKLKYAEQEARRKAKEAAQQVPPAK